MEGVISVIRFFIIFFVINFFIKFIMRMYILKKQLYMNKDVEDRNNIESSYEHNSIEDEIRNEYKKHMEELVYDEIYKKYLPKKAAYQLIENEKPKYFSNWESREQYIKQKNM